MANDRLGRALDRLFDADRAALLTDVVLAVGQAFALKFEEIHNDSTTVSFCGAYRSAWGRKIRGRTAPAINIAWTIDQEAIAYDHKSDGMYPLISNDRAMSPAQVLEAHKGQPMIEKRFEQIKTAHEIAPVFLKSRAGPDGTTQTPHRPGLRARPLR